MSGTKKRATLCAIVLCALSLAACGGGGGGGGGNGSASVTSFEIVDPSPAAGEEFSRGIVILSSGNIVVTDPLDSNVAPFAGAAYLYNPVTQTRIASIYGDLANDLLGLDGVTALANGNFTIASSRVAAVGIGATVGSVMLLNGTTGAQIGSAIAGDDLADQLGDKGVVALTNGNFVIVSQRDDVNGVIDAGSVRLVDGTTGIQIGAPIAGNHTDALFNPNVTALTNGNFVVAAPNADVNAVATAGSVMLINGTTGAQIGSTIAGDNVNDRLGSDGVAALANGNYVIASAGDDVNGITNAGSVMLVDGATGIPIGTPIAGDENDDQLGSEGVTALTNGNYVIASRLDDVAGIFDAGSAKLVNGTTGIQVSSIDGDNDFDFLGSRGVIALTNGNYVIASPSDDVNGIGDAGSVRLVDGTTGIQIGSTIAGDQLSDSLGFRVAALTNGHFAIASPSDDVNGIVDAGSVMLVDGATGTQIGTTVASDNTGDQLGLNSLTAIANGNFVVVSRLDDVNGIIDAGSVMVISGSTGDPIGNTIAGATPFDLNGAVVAASSTRSFFVLGLPLWDNNGLVDSGRVLVTVP